VGRAPSVMRGGGYSRTTSGSCSNLCKSSPLKRFSTPGQPVRPSRTSSTVDLGEDTLYPMTTPSRTPMCSSSSKTEAKPMCTYFTCLPRGTLSTPENQSASRGSVPIRVQAPLKATRRKLLSWISHVPWYLRQQAVEERRNDSESRRLPSFFTTLGCCFGKGGQKVIASLSPPQRSISGTCAVISLSAQSVIHMHTAQQAPRWLVCRQSPFGGSSLHRTGTPVRPASQSRDSSRSSCVCPEPEGNRTLRR